MDANTIQALISAVGFPIVCCGAMFWYINKTMKEFTQKIGDDLKELSKSISDNTNATTRLVTTVEILSQLGGDPDVT